MENCETVEEHCSGPSFASVSQPPLEAIPTGEGLAICRQGERVFTVGFSDVIAWLVANYTLADVKDAMVERAMRACFSNQTAAAAELGITRDQIRYHLDKMKQKVLNR